MGVTFTQATTVKPGDPFRSSDLRALARAFNDRIRSGLGDAAWRIAYWWLSPWRLPRNPDASGFLFPPIGEFLETYAHLPAGEADWPVSGPGEPEGANVASQMMGFIFGLEAAGVAAEDVRLTDPEGGGIPLWLSTRPPETAEEYWTLAKYQRGAYDPRTGALSTGALWIGQSHAYLQPGSRSMHGQQFGGYLPSPALGSTCADPGDGSPIPLNWQWLFTNLVTGATLTYGSCPEDPGSLAGGAPFYTLDNIVLFFNDGTIQVLPKKEWIDGPYTQNPRLRKLANGAYERAMNAFARDFRGPNQRPETHLDGDGWNDNAFDFQAFFSQQYLLAPAFGTDLGSSIVPVYPRFRSPNLSPGPGTMLRNQTGAADLHLVNAGFCAVGALFKAVKLVGQVEIEVVHDGTVIETSALEADASGSASQVIFWDPIYSGTVAFRIKAGAQMATGGYIEAELAELLDYKPQVRDAYVVLRIGGIDVGGPTDGTGLDFDQAKAIWQSYHWTGCANSLLGHSGLEGSTAEANRNAVLDSLRRLSRCMRMIRGDDVLGYAVQGGKSILWCRRYVAGLGSGVLADMWEGIVGAIAPTAASAGMTNEWVMTADFKAMRYSEGSIWKPDAYSRFWALSNRCHLLDPAIALDPISKWHYSYGQALISPPAVLISEAPSGYTYARYGSGASHINTKVCAEDDPDCEAARLAFYKSCRIYEPPPEVESCEAVDLVDGTQAVKITFKSRFHSHSGAPASIPFDRSSWVVADIKAESYRTWENAIREFLLWKDTSEIPSLKEGDWSQNYVDGGLSDQPWASIWPELMFVQLAREPVTDDGDAPDAADTPLWSDEFGKLEIYLHAMAPGYIDGRTSIEYACTHDTTGAYDYSFESLCFHAFGGRWFSALPAVPTESIDATQTRPDKPQGFGPLPNTLASSEVFNQFAKAINLLQTVRVMIPAKLETRTGTRTNQYVVSPFNAAGDNVALTGVPSSSSAGDYAVWYDAVPAPGGVLSWTGWSDAADFFGATAQATLFESGLSAWSIKWDELQVQYRWTLLDPDAINAIPPSWRDLVTDNGAILAKEEVFIGPVRRIYVDWDNGRQCHDGLIVADTVWNGAPGHRALDFEDLSTTVTTCGEFPVTGTLIAPTLPYSTHWASDMISTNPDNYCSGGPTSARTYYLINKDTILVTIPLVPAPTP